MDQQTLKLMSNRGKAKDSAIRNTKFVAMMKTRGLYKSLPGTEKQPKEPAPPSNGANNDEKENQKVLKDAYEKFTQVAGIK